MDLSQMGSFITFTPVMEYELALSAIATGPTAADKANAVLAKVKLRIRDGDLAYNRCRHEAALQEYKAARALLYGQLHPKFNGAYYATAVADLLPSSHVLEGDFILAAAQFMQAAQPRRSIPDFVAGVGTEGIPRPLNSFADSGYQAAGRSKVSELVGQSAAFIEEGRPALAIKLIESAQRGMARASAAARAALTLNLATAHVQSGDAPKGADAAEQARALFVRAKDVHGQAQAAHTAAVALEATNPRRAEVLFGEASTLLAQVRDVDGDDGLDTVVARSASDNRRAIVRMITARRSDVLSVRSSEDSAGWGMVRRPDANDSRTPEWTVGVGGAGGLVQFDLSAGTSAASDLIATKIYDVRIEATKVTDLIVNLADAGSASVYLNHLYSFVLPVKIGDAFHAMGRYAQAETSYKQAAAYKYLNKTHEATAVWLKLAKNVLTWGDSLYQDEQIEKAQAQYAKLVSEALGVPASFFYDNAKLAVPAGIAKQTLAKLGKTIPAGNAEISFHVVTAASRMRAILDGLDFYGTLLSPIHTFEYLQSVARGFAQGAVQAEHEFVNFTTQQEAETATRRELETMLAMAQAEAQAKVEAAKAAHEDVAASQAALELAEERHANAKAQRDSYASVSWQQIWASAAAQALGGGEDAMVAVITALADRLDNGETISGAGPLLAAAVTFSAGRRTRKYELAKMDDNIADLAGAIEIAKEMLEAAEARARVADITAQASQQRALMAVQALDAFDSEMFTPEVWSKMASVMRGISISYLHDAIRIAKLMQRAFNFDNDTQVSLIKNVYGHAMVNATTGGSVTLLGGDSLVRDIDSFTYHAVTGRTRKNSRIKDVISVARHFPAQFEEFRRTGMLELETDLYEFDRLHPGFHNQRIEAVEVEFAGLLPPEGLNGIVRCGGVTGYRTRTRGKNKRVHQVDTMALSDFTMRGDMFVYIPEVGLRGLFQGMGLATTWKVHLPRRSNDFDYARIFDVNLVLYYTAQFDPLLRKMVLSSPVRPGELTELRNFDLRFDFPESWFTLYREGAATFRLGRERLPFNQKDFQVQSVNWRVVTKSGVSAAGISLKLTSPKGKTGTAVTNAQGAVSTEDVVLTTLAAGSPVGDWKVEVTGGASLMSGGKLKFDRIHNIQMGLEYEFKFLPEQL